MSTLRNACLQHARFYLERVRSLDVEYSAKRSQLLNVLAQFDLEWGNFHTAFEWAQAQGDGDNEAAALCSMISISGAHLLPIRQHPQEMLKWNEIGLEQA